MENAVLYPFLVFTAVKLAPLVLGLVITSHSGLPDILKFPCRRTGRVTRLCRGGLGSTASMVDRALIVLGTLLFQGHSKRNQNLVVIVTLLFPLSGRLVVCVQVYNIGD